MEWNRTALPAHEIHDFVLDNLSHLRRESRAKLTPRDMHAVIHQILDDLVHVSPVEPNLGELGRLHFHERRIGDFREAARNLGFPATRGTDD